MTIRVLLSLCVLSVTVWARPYSGEDDDAFANLIQEIEAEGQAEGLSESDLGDLEDFESIELVEDPGLMLEDEEMGIAGESIESIDEIKKITPIKRIQKVKKIQEVKDIQEVPEHVARKFLEDHYEGEGNEGYEGEVHLPMPIWEPQNPDYPDPDYEVDPPETEDPMVEVSIPELANVRMLLEEALDALENIGPEPEIHIDPMPDHGEESEVGPPPDYPFGPDDIVDIVDNEDELPGIKSIQGLKSVQGLKEVTPLKSVQEITKMDEVVGLYELTDAQAEKLRELNQRKKGRKGNKSNKYGRR